MINQFLYENYFLFYIINKIIIKCDSYFNHITNTDLIQTNLICERKNDYQINAKKKKK